MREPLLPLRFPIGIAVNENYLYVADSGHHRILECDHGGRVLRQFGSGGPGFIDGADGAVGVQPAAGHLPAARHAVRRRQRQPCRAPHPAAQRRHRHDLRRRARRANRSKGRSPIRARSRWTSRARCRSTPVRCTSPSPATTGSGPTTSASTRSACSPVPAQLGVRRRQRRQGDVRRAGRRWPRCSRCCTSATAPGSAIRTVNRAPARCTTLLGEDAWNFGQADGARVDARLQHPQAIALDPDAPVLWIADSGNDALRMLRLGGGELSTLPVAATPARAVGLRGRRPVWCGSPTPTPTRCCASIPQSGALRHVPIGE